MTILVVITLTFKQLKLMSWDCRIWLDHRPSLNFTRPPSRPDIGPSATMPLKKLEKKPKQDILVFIEYYAKKIRTLHRNLLSAKQLWTRRQTIRKNKIIGKLGTKHPLAKGIHFCLIEGPHTFQRQIIAIKWKSMDDF